MYVPRHFEEQDPERLLALMRQHAFATLVTGGEAGAPFCCAARLVHAAGCCCLLLPSPA